MALRVRASLARLDKLKLIPRGACFSLPAGRKPGQSLRVTKGDEARPAMFFNRVVPDPRRGKDMMGHGWTRMHTDNKRLSFIRVHPCPSVAKFVLAPTSAAELLFQRPQVPAIQPERQPRQP